MIEAVVSATVAALAAGAALTNRINNRINDIDQRLDTFDLRVATQYDTKQDFETEMQKMEDHMFRIETKLDQMLLKNG